MNRIITFVLAAASILFSSNLVMAAPVPYTFSGVVTSIDDPLSSEFHVGEVITGHLSFEPLFNEPDPIYYKVSDFSANVGGDYPITSVKGLLEIRNDTGGGSFDAVNLDIKGTPTGDGLSAPNVSGLTLVEFFFTLRYGPSSLTSQALVPQFILNSPNDFSL